MSWCTCWKCQRYFPVFASMATIEDVKRLSPLRSWPAKSGEALPVEKYRRPRFGSTEGVCQIGAPPCFHDSPVDGHVSCPTCPGPGTVKKRQSTFPVCASSAVRRPRILNSPPEIPLYTRPS